MRGCGGGRAISAAAAAAPAAALLGPVVAAVLGPSEAALQIASFNMCWRRMPRGMVKRVPHSGPLVGYRVACPNCGIVRPYLTDETIAPFRERGELLEAFALKCANCSRTITLKKSIVGAP